MHRYTEESEELARAVLDYAIERVRMEPPELDGPQPYAELLARAGETITEDGLGGGEALRLFAEVLAPATISTDHPRHLAFIPHAPTVAAVLFDLVVGASSLYGGSWLESAGAVFAENQALRWIADLAGLPADAGGTFVSGGSAGNLSALVAARHTIAERRGGGRPERWRVAASAEVHSSVVAAARVMDVDVLKAAADDRGRLTGAALADALAAADRAREVDGVFAVVASAGTTNAGMVDDLAGVADVCAEHGLWLHVDGAYGGAALASERTRPLFDGIERADSFVVDPHKWLFAPFDCAALVYRDPGGGAAAHRQRAAYLDAITEREEWDPSDYTRFHLSRRAPGLPFWFSLATHGTRRYREAIDRVLDVAWATADEIRRRPHLDLVVDPMLSVVVFRRLGWTPADYAAWSDRVLAEGIAFVRPTTWHGETVMRFAFVNPLTTIEGVRGILNTMF